MPRMRMVKPTLFTHEVLYEASKESGLPVRLAYIGLWTQCDREGRFEWRPLRLKLAILPWDDLDFEKVLAALEKHGFILRYEVEGKPYGCIPSWHVHQHCHHKEADSSIPPPPWQAPDKPGADPGQDSHASGINPGSAQVEPSYDPSESESESESTYGIRNTESSSVKKKKFVPPSLDEVRAYCLERGNAVDPQRWLDYYASVGWKIGKKPMKDWQAAVRTWERNPINGQAQEKNVPSNGHTSKAGQGTPRPLTDEECERQNRTGDWRERP
jgi:hypothetical protein